MIDNNDNNNNNNCNVEFEFNPLGDLIVKWEISYSLINPNQKYLIEIPGFKYDLPKFLSIPVPFSSKSIELKTDIISKPDGINIGFSKARYGNIYIEIEKEPEKISSHAKSCFTLEYKISNIMNADGIYFVAVYPFRTPFDSLSHNIRINIKFSYNIRKYSFWERYFEYPSNKKLPEKNILKPTQYGDEFIIQGSILGNNKHTIDLHITGTRFPVYIRRDIFWLIVFIVSVLVFLSPIINEIIGI